MPWTIHNNGARIKPIKILEYNRFELEDKDSYFWEDKNLAEDWIRWLSICNEASNVPPQDYKVVEIIKEA